MTELSRERVIGYRVAAQGLLRDGGAVDDLAVLDFGLQDTSDSARLTVDARMKQPVPLDGVGPGRPLALAWTLRGAPHLHRRRDLDRVAGALWPLSEADASSRLDASASMRKAGMSALDGLTLGVDAIRKVVAAPTGKGAASTAVSALLPDPLLRYCRACRATHVFEMVFRMGALYAGIELEPGTAPPVLVARRGSSAVGALDIDAVRRLVRTYLTLLGPAAEGDVAGYLGARRADLAKVWPDDLARVSVDGKQGWLPGSQLAAVRKARRPRLTRLLGPYDPYLQARDRNLIVPDRALHKVLWPVLGRPGVLFVDGEVLGSWRTRTTKARLVLTVEPVAPLPPKVRREVEVEAERVGTARGAGDVQVTWLE